MHEKINQNRHSTFKKKEYSKILKYYVGFFTYAFGYTKKPILIETELPDNILMEIVEYKKDCYLILHDYIKFKSIYEDDSDDVKFLWLIMTIAHEMRHYYQMRQLHSKHPKEDLDLLAEWKNDNENWKSPSEDFTIYDFYRQPMELDAMLFAYYFVAHKYDICMPVDMIDENYIKDLEQHFIRLFGKTDESIFHFDDIQ